MGLSRNISFTSSEDVLVRAKLKGEGNSDLRDEGMKKCGKSSCQICRYVDQGVLLKEEGVRTSSITYLIVTQCELFTL